MNRTGSIPFFTSGNSSRSLGPFFGLRGLLGMVWVQGSHVTIAGRRPGLMPWLLRRVQGLGSAWGRRDGNADNSPMRIDLKVPFAEKDTAKALGARWDAAKKIWYVKDVADLTPFSRWIPEVKAASDGSSSGATRQSGKAAIDQTVGVITEPTVVVPHCGCNVQPWEDCEHTAKPTMP